MVKRGSRIVGYIRVSTREQGDSGLGLDAQRAAIEAEAARRGWVLEHVYSDVASGKDTRRDGLSAALSACESGLVAGLVVAKVDRLSRSLVDFAGLLARFTTHGWALVVLDLGVDTSTPSGRLVASVVAALAEWERGMISVRTRAALVEVRARGGRLGRPSGLPADVVARIRRERAAGVSLGKLAAGLNADGVPTGQGGAQWYASTVRGVLERSEAEGGADGQG
jgi:DNA invertase Pin-like site-specific DNA recombinase